MRKKYLALLLAVVLACSLFVTPAMAASFTDAGSSWAASSIDRFAGYGVLNGDGSGNIRPSAKMTRGELAQMMVNLLGLTEKPAVNPFKDLKGNEWYADAVLKCYAAGLMKGDDRGNCDGGSPISREGALVLFSRAVGAPEAKDTKALDKFVDGEKVSGWAGGALATLTELGILSGNSVDEPTADPQGTIDRASAFALLDKAIGAYVTSADPVVVSDPNKFVIVKVPADTEVTISGEAAGVVVAAGSEGASVTLDDLTAATVKVDAEAEVALTGDTAVDSVELNAEAEVAIDKGVTVDTVVANEAATIDNQGEIKTVEANKDGVVLDGNAPQKIETADGVEPPKDSEGNTVEEKPEKPASNYTPPTPSYVSNVSAAKLHDNREETTNGAEGEFVPDNKLYTAYSVSAAEGTAPEGATYKVVNVTINATHLMKHTNSNNVLQAWVGASIAVPAGYKVTKYATGSAVDTVAKAAGTDVSGDAQKEGIDFYVHKGSANKMIAVTFTEDVAEDAKTQVVVYVLNTDNVNVAPAIENVKVYLITKLGDLTAQNVPAAVRTSTALVTAEDQTKGADWAADDMPWVLAVFDSNVTGAITFGMKQDRQTVALHDPSENEITSSTIAANRFVSWSLNKQDNTQGGYVGAGTAPLYGEFALTITKDNETFTPAPVLRKAQGVKYVNVEFINSVTKAVVKKVTNVAANTTLESIKPTDEWKNFENAVCSGDTTFYKADLTTSVTTVAGEDGSTMEVYLKYAPKYAADLSVRPNGNIAGTTDGSFDYNEAYTQFGVGHYTFGTAFSFQVDEQDILNRLDTIEKNGTDKATYEAQLNAIKKEIPENSGNYYLMLGISATVPAGATQYSLDGGTNKANVEPENNGGFSFYTSGSDRYAIFYMTYYKLDDSRMTDREDPVKKTVTYYDDSNHIVAVETWSMKRTTTPAKVKVSFMDGTTKLKDVEVAYKNTTAASYGDSNPTKAGYTFSEWVTEENGNTTATLTNLTANTSVYAKWTENPSITIVTSGTGTVTLSGTGVVKKSDTVYTAPAGAEVTVAISTNQGGFLPVNNTVTLTPVVGSTGSYTFTMPASGNVTLGFDFFPVFTTTVATNACPQVPSSGDKLGTLLPDVANQFEDTETLTQGTLSAGVEDSVLKRFTTIYVTITMPTSVFEATKRIADDAVLTRANDTTLNDNTVHSFEGTGDEWHLTSFYENTKGRAVAVTNGTATTLYLRMGLHIATRTEAGGEWALVWKDMTDTLSFKDEAGHIIGISAFNMRFDFAKGSD